MAESSLEQSPEDMEAWSTAAMRLLEDAKSLTSEWHETSKDSDFIRSDSPKLGYTPHIDRGPKAQKVFDAKLGGAKEGLETAEAALQRCSAVLLQLQHERQSKWAAFKVCKWRLDLRGRRPLEENFRDHLQEALEHEMQVLTASRKTLANYVAEAKGAVEDCEANRVRLLRNVRLMVCKFEANPPPFMGEEVIAMLRQVVENRIKSFGACHPDTLRALSDLASQLAPADEAEERVELRALPLPALKKRAMAAGATKLEVQELCKQKEKTESVQTEVEVASDEDDLAEALINLIFSKQAVEARKLRQVIAERKEVLRLRREAAERREAAFGNVLAQSTQEASSDEVQLETPSLQEPGISAEAEAQLAEADIPPGPPRPLVPSDAEALLKRAPQLQDLSILLYRRSEALIEKERRVCEKAGLKTTSAFQKRSAENNALRKDLENQIAEIDSALAAAELSISRMRKRIQHFGETELQPKVDTVGKLVDKLRATREELEADLTRKVVSIRIDDSCRKITPERSMQDPMTMPVMSLLAPKPKPPPKGRRRANIMKRQYSCPVIDSALSPSSTNQSPLSPAGSSSPLKTAGNFLAS
mmetsp:Transcript_93469/g.145955  ORF Transcript_93469/g.145955 Transcript_93469/m.145955 type:complete len:590 (-) Transcript_93469:84-1853(-)